MSMDRDYKAFKRSLQGKKVLIVGLGLQGGGVGVARYFAKHGARVHITDKKTTEQLESSILELADYQIDFTLGKHRKEDFLHADLIIKGPSVPWHNPEILTALDAHIPVTMESVLFARYSPAQIIGITGTRGKSTTTFMTYEVLKRFYTKGKVHLTGNIPGACALELMEVVQRGDIVAMELSSWQLSGFGREQVSPSIAVLTNLYPDHLDYYQSIMDKYIADKVNIFQYQVEGDYRFAHAQTKELLSELKYDMGAIRWYDEGDFPYDLAIPGKHNQANAAAALLVCQLVLGDAVSREDIISCLQEFHGLSYRQQILGEKNGITFVNDSTSTTPIAAITALHTFNKDPLVLILGGNGKNLPTNDLITTIQQSKNLKKIVLLGGTFTSELLPELKKLDNIVLSQMAHSDMETAVREAYEAALTIGTPVTILLSPSATSFAHFRNEFDRAERFSKAASAIINA